MTSVKKQKNYMDLFILLFLSFQFGCQFVLVSGKGDIHNKHEQLSKQWNVCSQAFGMNTAYMMPSSCQYLYVCGLTWINICKLSSTVDRIH